MGYKETCQRSLEMIRNVLNATMVILEKWKPWNSSKLLEDFENE